MKQSVKCVCISEIRHQAAHYPQTKSRYRSHCNNACTINMAQEYKSQTPPHFKIPMSFQGLKTVQTLSNPLFLPSKQTCTPTSNDCLSKLCILTTSISLSHFAYIWKKTHCRCTVCRLCQSHNHKCGAQDDIVSGVLARTDLLISKKLPWSVNDKDNNANSFVFSTFKTLVKLYG